MYLSFRSYLLTLYIFFKMMQMFVTTGSVLAVTISTGRLVTREINQLNDNPDRDIDSNGNTSNHQIFYNKLYNQFTIRIVGNL